MVKNKKESGIILKLIPPLYYKFCGLVEEYRLELAKENPYLNLDIDLSGAIICGIHEVVLISKKFGFIKWLVENDKIDFDKVEKKFYNEICITDYGDKDRIMGDDDLVIAVLSVRDNPIEFLISILR